MLYYEKLSLNGEVLSFLKLMKLKVEEFKKLGRGAKSLNLLHLWLKLVIDKKMGWGERLNVLSYDFSYNIYVDFIPKQKVCNCINVFPCILWDFIVLGLVLSWWRSDQDSWRSHEKHMPKAKESVSFATWPTREMTCEMHW